MLVRSIIETWWRLTARCGGYVAEGAVRVTSVEGRGAANCLVEGHDGRCVTGQQRRKRGQQSAIHRGIRCLGFGREKRRRKETEGEGKGVRVNDGQLYISSYGVKVFGSKKGKRCVKKTK